MLQDKILVWRFNHGRPEVLHEVYDKYRTDLLTLAMALLGDLAAAEDVVQDVFLSLLRLSGRLKLNGSLKGYLTTSVMNGARNVIRAHRRHPMGDLDGVYPASLKTVTVVNAISPALKKRLSAKPDKELVARLMKVDRVGMMYTTLEHDGKDPAYYGDRVSVKSPQAVLFRWRIDDNTYRVVFGDLSTKDVSADKLTQLEAASGQQEQ